HPAGPPDGRVWDIAIAADLVRGVDDDDALLEIVGQNSGRFAQHRRLADAGPAHHQDAAARLDQVTNDADRAEHSPPNATGQADDAAFPVADGRNSVKGALDTGPIVAAEGTNPLNDVLEVLVGDETVIQDQFVTG